MLPTRNTVALFFFASKYYRCLFRAGHVIIVSLRLSVWIFVVKIHAAMTGDEQAQEEATTADATVLKAKLQLQAYEAEARSFLSVATHSGLSAEAKSFMFQHIVKRLQGGQTVEQAGEQAMQQWDREVVADGELRRWPEADATQRSFLRQSILTELERDAELSVAVESAARQWQRLSSTVGLVEEELASLSARSPRASIHSWVHRSS